MVMMYSEKSELFLPESILGPTVVNHDVVVSEALNLLGAKSVPYKGPELGMTEDDGFDCSGFVVEVFRRAGFPLETRHCNEMFDQDIGPLVHNFRPGNLLFTSWTGEAPNHVGIIIDESTYIHAPGRKNTKVKLSPWRRKPIKNLSPNAIYLENPIGIKQVAMKQGRWYVL